MVPEALFIVSFSAGSKIIFVAALIETVLLTPSVVNEPVPAKVRDDVGVPSILMVVPPAFVDCTVPLFVKVPPSTLNVMLLLVLNRTDVLLALLRVIFVAAKFTGEPFNSMVVDPELEPNVNVDVGLLTLIPVPPVSEAEIVASPDD